jgi:hypothetical protein
VELPLTSKTGIILSSIPGPLAIILCKCFETNVKFIRLPWSDQLKIPIRIGFGKPQHFFVATTLFLLRILLVIAIEGCDGGGGAFLVVVSS